MPEQITYLNYFQNPQSINNPVIDNGTLMRFDGFFENDWDAERRKFESLGFGLKKTRNSQSRIYCDDASSLFSMQSGRLGMVMSFPNTITNGVYSTLRRDTTITEHILWGVNIGQYQASQPSLYAALTPDGIQFTIWTSKGKETITDNTTNLAENTNVLIDFVWDTDGLEPSIGIGTFAIQINKVTTAIGNYTLESVEPASSSSTEGLGLDSIEDLEFSVLDTPFLYSNLECTIRWMATFSLFNLSSTSSESEGNTSSSSSSSLSSSSNSSLEFSSEGFSSSSSSSDAPTPPCISNCDIVIQFKTFTIPDRLIVTDQTGVVFDTGFISTGINFNEFKLFDLVCPVEVCVDAPNNGTAWELKIQGCGLNVNTQGGEGFFCHDTPIDFDGNCLWTYTSFVSCVDRIVTIIDLPTFGVCQVGGDQLWTVGPKIPFEGAQDGCMAVAVVRGNNCNFTAGVTDMSSSSSSSSFVSESSSESSESIGGGCPTHCSHCGDQLCLQLLGVPGDCPLSKFHTLQRSGCQWQSNIGDYSITLLCDIVSGVPTWVLIFAFDDGMDSFSFVSRSPLQTSCPHEGIYAVIDGSITGNICQSAQIFPNIFYGSCIPANSCIDSRPSPFNFNINELVKICCSESSESSGESSESSGESSESSGESSESSEGPAPASCPCWDPPPCGDLSDTYIIEEGSIIRSTEWSDTGCAGSQISWVQYEALEDITITAAPSPECWWEGTGSTRITDSSGGDFTFSISWGVNLTSSVWQLWASDPGVLGALGKSTGATPVGGYSEPICRSVVKQEGTGSCTVS